MPFDRSAQLLREGYPFAARLRGGSSAVPTRLLGRPAVVVGGPEGVRRFYDPRLRRRGAFPPLVKLVLFGPGAVHGLDDAEHHHRKAMFLDVLAPASMARLAARAHDEWSGAMAGWAGRDVVLFDEAVQVLGAAVLGWAGIPLADGEASRRARQLADVVDGFATPGAPYARAARSRLLLDRWARGLVQQTRDGVVAPPPGSALAVVAAARGTDGRPLADRVAAVELLNVVRPTVAVAWYVTFAALALHEHQEWRDRIAAGDRPALGAFAQEVRRAYPFVPVLAARARRRQDVLGVPLRRGGLVVLDVHGTDHDPQLWPDPDHFDPGRFLGRAASDVAPDTLVPQGGGDVATGHRCPREDVTLMMLLVAIRELARLPHTLPEQDLGHDLSRMPTRPRSGVVLRVA